MRDAEVFEQGDGSLLDEGFADKVRDMIHHGRGAGDEVPVGAQGVELDGAEQHALLKQRRSLELVIEGQPVQARPVLGRVRVIGGQQGIVAVDQSRKHRQAVQIQREQVVEFVAGVLQQRFYAPALNTQAGGTPDLVFRIAGDDRGVGDLPGSIAHRFSRAHTWVYSVHGRRREKAFDIIPAGV